MFQEKQANIKEQASSSLEARNSSYNDNVVRSDFSFKVKQTTASKRPSLESYIWVYKGKTLKNRLY